MELKVIIIDDEEDAIIALKSIIEISDDYKIIGESTDPVKGLELILQKKPDVVFLDIEMPRMNGFQLLKSISNVDFDIIFSTAYKHYAIQAIKANALDYILKPVSIPEVLNALEKVKNRKKDSSEINAKYKKLLSDVITGNSNRIKIPTLGGFEIIDTDNITYLEADGSYTTAFLKNSSKIVISKLIIQIEPLLDKNKFFRTHRSFLVNMECVRRFDREKNIITLENQVEVPLSRRRYNDFIDFLDQMDK